MLTYINKMYEMYLKNQITNYNLKIMIEALGWIFVAIIVAKVGRRIAEKMFPEDWQYEL